jgi:hypothetical protein
MPDNKHLKWEHSLGTDADLGSEAENATLDSAQPAANDADGWQQYRRWISKAPAPRERRAGIDPALYTWKGYRDWSDQVKRNWSKETSDDND